MATETRSEHPPEGHAPRSPDEFDREISRRTVLGFLAGILVLTAVAMWGMWYMSAYLHELALERTGPLTEVQQQRNQTLEELNRRRAQTEVRIYPHLTLPEDVESLPSPPIQVAPWVDMGHFLSQQEESLTMLGWSGGGSSKAHLPIEEGMEKVLQEGLPVQPSLEPRPQPSGLPGVAGAVGGSDAPGGTGDDAGEGSGGEGTAPPDGSQNDAEGRDAEGRGAPDAGARSTSGAESAGSEGS